MEPFGYLFQEPKQPIVIYSSTDGMIMTKDGSKLGHVASALEGPMAYDPMRRQILWIGGKTCHELGEDKSSCLLGSLVVYRRNFTEKENNNATPSSETFFFRGSGFESSNLQIVSFEYDWIGDNVYFTCGSRRVYVCGERGNCSNDNNTKMLDVRNRKMAVDPSKGRMYWIDGLYTENEIWMGSMDLTVEVVLMRRNQMITHITMDNASLFWTERAISYERDQFWEVYSSDLDGNNPKLTITLKDEPLAIRNAGKQLFWVTTEGLRSCEKGNGNNLMTQEIRHLKEWKPDFLLVDLTIKDVGAVKDPCSAGELCSHICVPTPAGYMRCLCPFGYKLQSDGWTCECENARFCGTSERGQILDTSRQPSFTPLDTTDDPLGCRGNEFPCAGTCIAAAKLCDGFRDCADYSDEGERCNEVCISDNECSHLCVETSRGPTCFCPPEQTLAQDNSTCILIRSDTEEGKGIEGLIFGGLMGLALIMFVILGTFKYQKNSRKLRHLTEAEIEEFKRGDPTTASTAPDGLDRALSLPYTRVLSPNDIIKATEIVLGSGEFGIVYPGICNSEPVAIKTFKRTVEIDEFKAVLAELKIMAYLGDHEFIVKFVGAEISDIAKRNLMIVTELSPHGDLLRYLWKVGKVGLKTELRMLDYVAGDHDVVTVQTLNRWCEQIATGMEYLTQRQIVHGDLAARNVLVFRDDVVKISDFGLSKQLYGSTHYQRKKQCKLPWRWAAIELLTSMEFSEGSDVWAFAVTAWEIFSLGQTPYKGMAFSREFLQFLQAGNRLPKPEHASDEIYNILSECWNSERSKRPDFCQLRQIIQNLSVAEMRGSRKDLGHEQHYMMEESNYVAAV